MMTTASVSTLISSFIPPTGHADAPLMRHWLFSHAGIPANTLTTLAYDFVLVATVFVGLASAAAMIGIWAERKVSAHIHSRIGPNRVGPIGLLQSIADGVKLLLKEDLLPRDADGLLFRLAAYLAFVPVFMAFLALPFGPELTFEPRLAVGVFWILAVLSVEVIGVILAGWSSNNKWSVYGAMREACQMVSYEIPLGLSIIVAVMACGTLNLVTLGHLQSGGVHTWLIFRNPFVFTAFFVYFIASLASNKRAPFDLPESESELVAGYHTEYSGLRFSFFFFAEYAAMFVIGGIQTALFLGGWNDPFGLIGYYHAHWSADPQTYAGSLILLNFAGAGLFLGKCALLIYVQMWVRWTLPRPRIDQVLYTCIKVLLPGACVLLLGAAIWQLFVGDMPGRPWETFGVKTSVAGEVFNPWNLLQWKRAGAVGPLITQLLLAAVGVGGFSLALLWIGYALLTRGRIRQRLTDPAEINVGPAFKIAGASR